MPKIDFSDPDLQPEDAPYKIDYDMNELLDLELRPLRICLVNKDYKLMQKIWKKYSSAWESCHFYKFLELIIQRKD